MLRSLFLFVFLSWPAVSSSDRGARDPLTASHERAFADARSLTPLVEKRFALAAAAQHCDLSDNNFAFELALDKFEDSERFTLEKAAEAGLSQGARSAADDSCPAAIDRLRSADDDLLARAELLPSR